MQHGQEGGSELGTDGREEDEVGRSVHHQEEVVEGHHGHHPGGRVEGQLSLESPNKGLLEIYVKHVW